MLTLLEGTARKFRGQRESEAMIIVFGFLYLLPLVLLLYFLRNIGKVSTIITVLGFALGVPLAIVFTGSWLWYLIGFLLLALITSSETDEDNDRER